MLEATHAAPAASNPEVSSAVPTANVKAAAAEVQHKVNGVDIKEEPMEVTNGIDNGGGGGNKRVKTEGGPHFNSSGPYEFSDDKKDGKVRLCVRFFHFFAIAFIGSAISLFEFHCIIFSCRKLRTRAICTRTTG